jgi:hypothetical protein
MNSALISDLHRIESHHGAEIFEGAEHVQLLIKRSGLSVSLTIPRSVLEWFVDVHDADGVCLIKDWLDYAGYDATPESQLAEDMRDEVLRFVDRLLDRNLRLVQGHRSSLEWQVGERWLQAVPFTADAEQALPADARKASRG